MSLGSWAAFAAALVIALVVPGPDLVVVAHAATHSIRRGVLTAMGVVLGLGFHAALAAGGLTALVVSLPAALTALQVVGACILFWFGISMARNTGIDSAAAAQPGTGVLTGFVTNATNPKALLFFAAVLPQFIGDGPDRFMRTVAMGVTVVVGAAIWWAVMIALTRTVQTGGNGRFERALPKAGGLILVCLAGGLLWSAVCAGISVN
ncbi:Threonine/homoserine/homoserine lactone efflux protein [Rhodococcus pyridinivorans]|uniref:LysE family translocator n=1 Tax=Rhodococcus pyridinivorans TaxID=103816 RepID=UPI0007CD7E70|nr:LysE family transporter [Rhodococcus pyridinivorans]SEE11589.1 Threonine/homoserine/homoserine lactone efflux protein [Rhodococcus pyridinivorans]